MSLQCGIKGRISGKVAVISGSGSGIGRETALLFAREGGKIAVIDIDPIEGSLTAELIRKQGGEAVYLMTDITSDTDVQNMVDAVAEVYGRIDILINNAGIYLTGDVTQATENDWQRVMDVNLKGAFLCMKYCIRQMLKTGGGTIVNVSSEAGLVGMCNQVVYNISKSGMVSLTKSTALDFALKNIRVNCICPGRSLTPLVQKVVDNSEDSVKTLKILSEDRPLKRMANPVEIACGILYLASDEASFVTGTVLSVDGGYTAQ